MLTVTKLEQTCSACPSQWSGETDDGREVYIRYRWGCLTVDVDGDCVYDGDHGDGLDGMMSTEDMLEITGITVEDA